MSLVRPRVSAFIDTVTARTIEPLRVGLIRAG